MEESLAGTDIIQRFGLSFNPAIDCIGNGINNGVRIIEAAGYNHPPQIYFLNKYWHAYLVWKQVVLNWGVTSEFGDYPNESFKVIRSQGRDRTIEYLDTTIQAFISKNPFGNTFNQRFAVETTFSGTEKAALETIKKWRQKLAFLHYS